MTACICWALATTAPGGTIDAWTLIVFPGGVCPPSGPCSDASVGGKSARGGVESGPDDMSEVNNEAHISQITMSSRAKRRVFVLARNNLFHISANDEMRITRTH